MSQMADEDNKMLEPCDPEVMLLPLGVVDIEGNEITQTELMAHALANCTEIRHDVKDYYI
jgi:hypothetical protein